MENNPVLLKSSVFGGFKKKDVLSYIFELNETTQEEKQKLAEQVEELVYSRDTLAAAALDMEQKLASLQSSLDEACGRLDEETEKHTQARKLIETLKAEAETHKNTIAQQNAELARQAELGAQLSEKNRAYEEKRHQVELAASQIAGLLGQAQEDAEKNIARAKLEAEKIVENAKASLSLHVAEANQSVAGAYRKFSEFKAELENLYISVQDTANAMNDEIRSLKASVDDIENLVPPELCVDDLPSLQDNQKAAAEPAVVKTEAEAETKSPVSKTAAASPSVQDEANSITTDILRRYGVRKDDSGFFRLAAE